MATFEVRVEGLTGLSLDGSSSPTQDELTEYLKDGVLDITNRVLQFRPQDSELFMDETGLQVAQGADVGGARVISVVRADGDTAGNFRSCRKISPALQYLVTDIDSLHYASRYNPVYMLNTDNTIKVFPVPSDSSDTNSYKVYYVNNTPKDGGGGSLTFEDSTLAYFPADKIYLVVLYAGIKSLQNALASKSDNLPSDVSEIVLDVLSESLPSYTAPSSFVLPTIPVQGDVDFSSVGSIETFTGPTFTPPTLATLTSMSLPSVPTPPIFTDNSVTLPSSGIPTYVKPLTAPDYDDANNWINVEEDDEMLSARMQVIQSNLSQYSSDIQNALNNMNMQNVEYQAKLQKALQDSKLSGDDQGMKIQKFATEISSYQAEVGKEIDRWMNEEYNVKFNEWQQEYQGGLAKYNSDIQKESARVSTSIEDFNAEVGKALQEYSAKTGYDVSIYQSQIEAAVQKYQNDLADASTTFDKNLTKYATETERASANNNIKITKLGADIQNYSSKVAKIQADYEWMTSRLMKLQQEYDAAFALMQPKQQREG